MTPDPGPGPTTPARPSQPGDQRAQHRSAPLPASTELNGAGTSWGLMMQLNEDLQRLGSVATFCPASIRNLSPESEEPHSQRFRLCTGWVAGQRCAS